MGVYPRQGSRGNGGVLQQRTSTKRINKSIMTGMESRIKRALYRASHRGTKEMDLVLGRFAEAGIQDWDGPTLDAFEDLLALPDPQIDRWVKGEEPPPGVAPMIARIRRYHRLES